MIIATVIIMMIMMMMVIIIMIIMIMTMIMMLIIIMIMIKVKTMMIMIITIRLYELNINTSCYHCEIQKLYSTNVNVKHLKANQTWSWKGNPWRYTCHWLWSIHWALSGPAIDFNGHYYTVINDITNDESLTCAPYIDHHFKVQYICITCGHSVYSHEIGMQNRQDIIHGKNERGFEYKRGGRL